VLPRGYHAYPFPGGRIYLDLRESPTMLARVLGVYESSKIEALRRCLPPGGTFVDVGGNKGDFALIAARHLDGSGRVICVEPAPENARWIRRSVERNGYQNVEVVEAALADHDGSATLHLGPLSGWHSLAPAAVERSVGSVEVPTVTLDHLLAERGIDHVDVMKIDVEGGEGEVLGGASGLLGGDDPVTLLIDLHPGFADVPACLALLEHSGFTLRDAADPDRVLADPGPRTAGVVAVRGPWATRR
jgi:FkbM family methyltransferase